MVIVLSAISCVLKMYYRSGYSTMIDTTLLIVAITMFVAEPKKVVKSA